MELHELPASHLQEAPWNPNAMDGSSLAKLRASIRRFGLVSPLLVRHLGDAHEVLSGNQRLRVLRELGVERVTCVVVEADDAEARLLAQAMNHLHGVNDPGLEAELLRTVVERLGEEQVLSILPEGAARLRELATIGTQGIASYLQSWEEGRAGRLRHFTARLSAEQLDLVDEVLAPFMDASEPSEHPNRRGNALYRLCRAFRERGGAS